VGRPTPSGRFSETVGVDFFVELSFWKKRIHARVFSSDPFRLLIAGLTHARQRQRSDRDNERHLLHAGDCLGFGPPEETTFADETGERCAYLVVLARS
jgi:hypothetical protein